MSYSVDTNLLLRSVQPAAPQHQVAVTAINSLQAQGKTLCITPQNLIEFWSVATRPQEANGLGLPPERVVHELQYLQRRFTLLPDTAAIFDEWLGLVTTAGVIGRRVHDARLVAVMRVYGVSHILTFNVDDFVSYPGIVVVHPNDVPAPPAPEQADPTSANDSGPEQRPDHGTP